MKRGLRKLHEREALVLARMELTRAQLLAANKGLGSRERARESENSLTFSKLSRALIATPDIALLGSIMIGSLLIGPRRVLPTVVRTGLTAWIARQVRAAIAR
ncbi:hypothetical protein PWP93_26105 [Paraburkholderia sp. A1RI-2L]|uniref:hypothetical protein n=1 Tax=Paraburkholderia sp. A1RI-2L TaxID=3028367 RepID=UPI003B7613C3